MKIAIISSVLDYPWGGADKLWTQAAEAAQSDGHSLLLAIAPSTAMHPRVKALRRAGAHVHLRAGRSTFVGWRTAIRESCQRAIAHDHSLCAALDQFAPDVALLNQGGTFDFLLEQGIINWLRQTRCPYVVLCQSNGTDERLTAQRQTAARMIFSQARAVVFVSTHNQALARSQLASALANALVIQNPVEMDPADAPTWPDISGYRIAVVARLESQVKGHDLLLQSFAHALAGQPDWSLDFYGQGPDEADLRARALKLGIGDRVRFCGFTPEVRQIWADHHLLALASRREGSSLAMLEALACGRPVLMPAVGGVSDWVEDGKTGFISPDNEQRNFTSTVARAWASRASWQMMGAAARHHFVQRRDPLPGRTLLGATVGASAPVI